MWNLESKRNPLQERMLLVAPEVNPHEFVRRYLLARSQAESPRSDIYQLDRRQIIRQQKSA